MVCFQFCDEIRSRVSRTEVGLILHFRLHTSLLLSGGEKCRLILDFLAHTAALLSGNMSGGSTSRNRAETSATGPEELIGTHLVFDSHSHSLPTKNRLLSASHFILKHSYDRPSQELENLMETSTETYLRAGEESLRRFLAAKLMASNMIHLEDSIIRATPDQKYNDVSDEALNSIIKDHLEQHETLMLKEKEVTLPDGTRLTKEMIRECLKTRTYVREPPKSSNDAETCCICLKDLNDGDKVAGMGYCKHEYHAKCIIKWLCNHNCCPLCKELALSPRVGYPDWVTNLDMLRGFLKRGDVYSEIDFSY
ncbi:E3 ubiquitin-protein ligase [Forsythia ovata]|uniref:RING-type E3 ubiquitin transferase n=1 Tax=Forsythia ovata TaxID=205694 RepID=A0ABD1UBS9_9LAMI